MPDQHDLQGLILSHMDRYPHMQLQDLYKLLLQSVMGCEHAVSDIERARSWLEMEITRSAVGPVEPLFDPISPDGAVIRLHLRPYIEAGMDMERLLVAFIRTSCDHRGSSQELIEAGRLSSRMAKNGLLPFETAEILTFWNRQEEQGFPATHHSESYQSHYHPAYRVISRRHLEEL